MSATPVTTGGLIVNLEGEVKPSLRRIARTHSMLVLEAEAADQALHVVLRERPCVVIVQLGRILNETLKLIRFVAMANHPVSLIAAATRHSTVTEQAVLRAGATYYVPDLGQDHVNRLVEAVLQKKGVTDRMSSEC